MRVGELFGEIVPCGHTHPHTGVLCQLYNITQLYITPTGEICNTSKSSLLASYLSIDPFNRDNETGIKLVIYSFIIHTLYFFASANCGKT